MEEEVEEAPEEEVNTVEVNLEVAKEEPIAEEIDLREADIEVEGLPDLIPKVELDLNTRKKVREKKVMSPELIDLRELIEEMIKKMMRTLMFTNITMDLDLSTKGLK